VVVSGLEEKDFDRASGASDVRQAAAQIAEELLRIDPELGQQSAVAIGVDLLGMRERYPRPASARPAASAG